MSKHDEARRAFLIGAVAGAGAAVAGAGVVSEADAAQTRDHHKATAAQASTQPHAAMAQHGAFFNDDDGATIAAFTERLMPGAPGMPGARDAGVLNYIDLALSGAYADLREFYRNGLAQLDAYSRKTYNGPFRQLTAAQQDEVITALEAGKATEFTWPPAQAFFNTLRTHTVEGMFADPVYGGNKDFAGWKLVGFPGAHMAFTPEDMQSNKPYSREPITGLQAQAKARRA
jgi:gluconate 2-dehydrogenase gamma chain